MTKDELTAMAHQRFRENMSAFGSLWVNSPQTPAHALATRRQY